MTRSQPARIAGPRWPLRGLIALGLAFVALASPVIVAGDDATARVQVGVRLFRSLLAADTALEQRADSEGRLLVLVFYASDASRAGSVARQLGTPPEGQSTAMVRDMPVVLELTSDSTFSAYATRQPAAIFVAEPLKDDTLRALVRYGVDHRLIVYSPLAGHVEKGVLGGISVEAKVQPYLNRATLQASGVTLKPFFLQVAKFAE